MTLVDLTIAVADATKGTNLLDKSGYSKSKWSRRIVHIAYVGSAAADDSELILKYGSTEMGRIRNSKTGLVVVNEDMRPHSSVAVCPASDDLGVSVSVAPATNPVKLIVDIQEF